MYANKLRFFWIYEIKNEYSRAVPEFIVMFFVCVFQPGDEIVRLNGFAISQAIHNEVLQLISAKTDLTLKVRRKFTFKIPKFGLRKNSGVLLQCLPAI